MWPEIASLGPFTIHSYGLLVALGVFAALFGMGRSARRTGFPPPSRVADLVFVAVFSGFLGARVFYVIQEWPFYRENPLAVFKIWEGGVIFSGGMIGAIAGLFLYSRTARTPFLASLDFTITYVPLVHAFGRVGCFLNGCCYGKPCDLPWAVQFPLLDRPVHPTQLYEAAFNLGLFGFLYWFYSRRRFTGQVTALYFLVYPAGRFFLEFLRADQPVISGLTLQQPLSLIFILGAAGLYEFCRGKKFPLPSRPAGKLDG